MKKLGARVSCVAVAAAVLPAWLTSGAAHGSSGVHQADPAGDAHMAGWHCLDPVYCGGVPAPVSAPSVDLRLARIDRVGGDLVVSLQVADLDDVPRFATPEDLVGWDVFFHVDSAFVGVHVQQTAAHGSRRVVVEAIGAGDRRSTGAATAAFDFAANTIRVTVPLARLNQAVADVCGVCPRVDYPAELAWPQALAWHLSAAAGSQSGPLYTDRLAGPNEAGGRWTTN